MGIIKDCFFKKKSDIPFIKFIYSAGDKNQKNFCMDLIKNLNYQKPIQFNLIANNDNNFEIILKYKNKKYPIRNAFDKDEEIAKILDEIFDKIETNKKKRLESTLFNFPTSENLIQKINIDEKNMLKEISSKKMEKINKDLELVCKCGIFMKEKIVKNNKYMEINDALNNINQDQEIFALCLLGKVLEKNGIKVVIGETISEMILTNDNLLTGFLQFLIYGINKKKKYILICDYGEEQNKKILVDSREFIELKEKLKEDLSTFYNISKEKLIIVFPKRDILNAHLIFLTNEVNDVNIEGITKKFNFIKEIKEINTNNVNKIMEGFILAKEILNSKGNNFNNWPKNEVRGNRQYDAPVGWIGIGLNIEEYGDKEWLGMNGSGNEWCVAYRGFEKNKAINEGIRCTPKIMIAEKYAEKFKIKNKLYKILLMVRVKGDAIRESDNFWYVDGTSDEIRPYRILFKEEKEKQINDS